MVQLVSWLVSRGVVGLTIADTRCLNGRLSRTRHTGMNSVVAGKPVEGRDPHVWFTSILQLMNFLSSPLL
jgi:hypothetical protein